MTLVLAPLVTKLLLALLAWVLVCAANGLSKYPEASTLFRSLSDRISILSNSDSPGTFKMLGRRSRPPSSKLQPPDNDEHNRPTNPRLPAAMFLPWIGFAMFMHCGPVGKDYAVRYGACMEKKGLAVGSTIPSRVQTVLSSADKVDTAVAELEQIAAGGFLDATICAVQAWLGGDAVRARPMVGALAGQEFLDRHGVK